MTYTLHLNYDVLINYKVSRKAIPLHARICQISGLIMASDTDDKDLSSMSPLSSDDEFDENDPFVHRIVMSPRRWFRTYLLTPTN